MKIILSKKGAKRPIIPNPGKVVPKNPGVPDAYGAFSVEEFPYTDDLKYTHEDAEGFLDYLENFEPRNFWYQDGHVKNWAFGETYDNWQDTYGVDAVLAAYISSHGNMGADGNFRASMGADWSDQGHHAYSSNMRIGNEQANYVWWSTCLSIRIRDGHDPIRTWSPASLGFRMMFGYETVSEDDSDYGEDFWDEWNAGKSFSTAFLDTSWDISSDQIPVVVAVGATEDEATDRVFNEDMLYWDHVSDDWWWWRWYEKANPARREPNRNLPEKPLIAILKRTNVDGRYVRNVLRRHRIDLALPRQVVANINGTFHVRQDGFCLSFFGDGAYEIQYAQPDLKNTRPLSEDEAIRHAERFIGEEKLANNMDLVFDCLRYEKLGGAKKGKDYTVQSSTIETTVEFTQVINKLPVISQKRGKLRISMDNNGRITRLQNHTRPIQGMSKQGRLTQPGPEMSLRMHEIEAYHKLLARGWEQRRQVREAMGKEPSEYRLIPGTDEIGYEIIGNEAGLYARGLIEITMPEGVQKRYTVRRPIFA
jgi:hypothetical protein